MATNCDAFYLVQSSDTCSTIASKYGINLATFYAWNPAVGSSCLDLELNEYVCVGLLNASSTAVSTTTMPTSTGISTPSSVQTGMVSGCDAFYAVKSGDTCSVIASEYDISLAPFYGWNPAVGSSCLYLEVGGYVCVGVVGSSSVTATPTSYTPSSTMGVSTPSPIQTGMVSDCDEFYDVESGDTCSAIASEYDIS